MQGTDGNLPSFFQSRKGKLLNVRQEKSRLICVCLRNCTGVSKRMEFSTSSCSGGVVAILAGQDERIPALAGVRSNPLLSFFAPEKGCFPPHEFLWSFTLLAGKLFDSGISIWFIQEWDQSAAGRLILQDPLFPPFFTEHLFRLPSL